MLEGGVRCYRESIGGVLIEFRLKAVQQQEILKSSENASAALDVIAKLFISNLAA